MPVAAFDLGGTKLAGALFDAAGHTLHREVAAIAGRSGRDVGGLIRQLVEKLERAGTVDGIGVAVPGIYRSDRGTVWAPNIPGWEDYPLRAELESAYGVPVAIESDRTCYIMGEQWRGHARGSRNAIFIAVGTGIGAGLLVDGRVLRGAHDIAGAIGWLALDTEFHSEYAGCGNFEYHASGPGLARAAGVATAEDAFIAYARGEPEAVGAVLRAVSLWGRAVANLVSLLNPEVIIFGGGVFGPATTLLPDIYEEALRWAQPISIRQVRLHASALGADAGLYGAAAIALQSPDNRITVS